MPGSPNPPQGSFLRALRGLLRPLVKAMIAAGVTVPAVYRLLKQVYVEVAEQDFAIDGKRPTDSRISLLTGVHRKDVRAIREARDAPARAAERHVTAIATVVGRWMADPRTTDAEGRPLPLPRQSSGVGGPPGFDDLVASVSKDIRPRTVLDELLRQRVAVHNEAAGTVSLAPGAVLGPGSAEHKTVFFADNLADHVSAATENLLSEGESSPFFERAVFYNGLTAGSVDAVEAEARAAATEMLAALNRLAYERQAGDRQSDGARERFRLGVFFFRCADGGSAGETGRMDEGGRRRGGTEGEGEQRP